MKVFHTNGSQIALLSNGDFSVNGNINHNRHNSMVGDSFVVDMGSVCTIHALHICVGNAKWGGSESAKGIKLWSHAAHSLEQTKQGKWVPLDSSIICAAKPDKQSFELPACRCRFLKLQLVSNHGNGQHAVLRQIGFHVAKSASNGIVDVCEQVNVGFEQLQADRGVVDECLVMLRKIHSKGIQVEAAFEPLQLQSAKIGERMQVYKARLAEVQASLAKLRDDINADAEQVQ